MFRLPIHQIDPGLPLPRYVHDGDAGADLFARQDSTIAAGGGRSLVPTGVIVAIPRGYAGFIQPRSGLALKHGVTCLNSPGLIDSGYRGELKVLLINTDPNHSYDLFRGDRIAQLVIQKVELVTFEPMDLDELPTADRDSGGFGHSGR